MLFHWRDGRIASPSGQDHAHANLSPRQAKERGLLMSATCGPLSSGTSSSAALQLSLESRLRARMDVNGSPEYALTWKTWDMLLGPPICALRASARRISGNDYSGWPTPDTGAGGTGPSQASRHAMRLQDAVKEWSGWTTPNRRYYGRFKSKRPPLKEWKKLRLQVFQRDGYRCTYCGCNKRTLHCDHVLAISKGGSNSLDNLVTACELCNSSKGNRSVTEWRASK